MDAVVAKAGEAQAELSAWSLYAVCGFNKEAHK
jgi:hypothetical protein